MPSALLDTHILIWWRLDTGRLSRQQIQTLSDLESRGEPLAISAITLRELAVLGARGRLEVTIPWDIWLQEMETSPQLCVLPRIRIRMSNNRCCRIAYPKATGAATCKKGRSPGCAATGSCRSFTLSSGLSAGATM